MSIPLIQSGMTAEDVEATFTEIINFQLGAGSADGLDNWEDATNLFNDVAQALGQTLLFDLDPGPVAMAKINGVINTFQIPDNVDWYADMENGRFWQTSLAGSELQLPAAEFPYAVWTMNDGEEFPQITGMVENTFTPGGNALTVWGRSLRQALFEAGAIEAAGRYITGVSPSDNVGVLLGFVPLFPGAIDDYLRPILDEPSGVILGNPPGTIEVTMVSEEISIHMTQELNDAGIRTLVVNGVALSMSPDTVWVGTNITARGYFLNPNAPDNYFQDGETYTVWLE